MGRRIPNGANWIVLPWRNRLPHPALVFVVLAWGFNFSVIKLAYKEMSPAAVGLFRYLWMLPLLCLCCVVAKQSLRYPKGQTLKFNLAGFVGSGAYMVLFLEGMRSASPTMGAIALTAAPIITLFLSVIFKQDKFSWRLVIGSTIAFAGVAVAVLDHQSKKEGSVFGTLLVVASAALWAVSIILYRPLLREHNPLRVLTLSFPGASLAIIPYGFTALTHTDWSKVTANGWLALAYLVVIAGVGAFIAYYKGLSDVGPARSSMTQYFVPPVAALFSALVLREPVTVNEVIGLVVVIAGVATASVRPAESLTESA